MVEKIISRTFLVIFLLFKTQHHPLLSREYPPFFDPREIAMLFIPRVDKCSLHSKISVVLKKFRYITHLLVFSRQPHREIPPSWLVSGERYHRDLKCDGAKNTKL